MKTFLVRFIVVILVVELIFWGIFGVLCLWRAKMVDAPTENLVVVLDAGHGGIDAGVTGVVTGVKESDLNLEMAFVVKTKLENRGATVVMTRTDKGGLYGTTAKGFKLRDMEKRREIIQKASPDIVISIHMNKFSDGKRCGPQVFYQKGAVNGKALAESVQSVLNVFTKNNHESLSGDFYVCQCVDSPSVIVECGFLSNESDEKKLCDKSYQDALGEEIIKGIYLYLYSH